MAKRRLHEDRAPEVQRPAPGANGPAAPQNPDPAAAAAGNVGEATAPPAARLPTIPEEQALMARAQAIYLDTQPLVESNWPNGSARLREFCTMARGRGIPLVVVEPVLEELEQQLVERVEEANDAIRRASKLVSSLGAIDWTAPPVDVNAGLTRYREQVTATLRTLFVNRVPVTTASAADLFKHAVARARPFHVAGDAKDAGFKDAVILRSICDEVERRGFARVVLVTADSDHGNTEAFHPAARTLNKRTLGQALNALRTGAATVEQVRQWRQRLELASELAAGDLARLSGFVASDGGNTAAPRLRHGREPSKRADNR